VRLTQCSVAVGDIADAKRYCVRVHACIGEGQLLCIALHPGQPRCKTCSSKQCSRRVQSKSAQCSCKRGHCTSTTNSSGCCAATHYTQC
jgi:hypothetical protein